MRINELQGGVMRLLFGRPPYPVKAPVGARSPA
jgi:hypothetical protein